MLVHVLFIRVPAVVCEEVKEDGNPVLSMDDPELEAGLRLQNRKSKALKQCVLHPPPHDSELRWKNPADEPGTSPRARQRDDQRWQECVRHELMITSLLHALVLIGRLPCPVQRQFWAGFTGEGFAAHDVRHTCLSGSDKA